ncbi:MAG: hypothetical protein HY925_06590 [Elusimicrobia bacterium]|nr:hypothetical protein [Elusimicrobiota bacterium]
MERIFKIVAREDPAEALADWLARPASERIDAVELLRAASYRIAGFDPAARLERVVTKRERFERPA